MTDTIVIGAGLFGSIIARRLRSMGQSVMVLDWPRKGNGSTPAACLIKPSWVSSLGRDVIEPSMRLLDEEYGVQDIDFKVGPVHSTVHWVDPRQVLSETYSEAQVEEVSLDGRVRLKREDVRAPTVVVAAGVWSNAILPAQAQVRGLVGKAGVAFTWPGHLDQPFISPWAPYKQLVAFNRGPNEIWVGDGTALNPDNFDDARLKLSMQRCADAIGTQDYPSQILYGIRPYVSGYKPCYLSNPSPNLWVATGGAKNGTLAAAWCAHTIAGALS